MIVNLEVEENLWTSAGNICEQKGLSLLAAIRLFCKTLERERRIPFDITADLAPFWNKDNIRYLEEKLAEYDSGQLQTEAHELLPD